MSVFRRRLAAFGREPGGRRWLFVPYDQLSDRIGPLAREHPRDLGIVIVESRWKADRRPYHKQKLAFVLANLRHFALEQAARGVAVRRVVTAGTYREALDPLAAELGQLRVMEPAERELRADLAPLFATGRLQRIPHEGWLSTADDFKAAVGSTPPWRMEAFYRHVRIKTGLLVRAGKPVGGKWSFDVENRRRWNGSPPTPTAPAFPRDEIKEEVCDLVRARYANHPGALDPDVLPATEPDAERLWQWAKRSCLRHFGPFEDAMSTVSPGLFHTRISALLNVHRLLPRRVVAEVARMKLPLASQEGFIRQVLGWREFVRHVHEATDGFRRLPGVPAAASADAAAPSALGAQSSLPDAFWGAASGLGCLDRVIMDVWREGWTHHITRLMVLGNLATLLEVAPRVLTDWFWAAYIDAYDWVVEPNVLGMGTYATGDVMTTKPYVSGAAYIKRMSDYCDTCAFDPDRTCPITRLYWAFLARHRTDLKHNARMAMPLRSLAKRTRAERRRDAITFERVRAILDDGRRVDVALLPGRMVPRSS